MKTNKLIPRLIRHFAVGSFCICTVALCQPIPGLPEPGLIIYGSITNSNGGIPVLVGNVTWQISAGAPLESSTINATVASVNGLSWVYVARVPFETRSVSGTTFTKTPNTLLLTNGVTYTRSATVNGTNATIVFSSRGTLGTFTFNAVDRGLMERVNLQVSLPLSPFQDADGDGMSDYAESIAGTDPLNPNSVFKASTDIQPAPAGGLIIKWASVVGKTYAIHRTTNLGQTFAQLAANLPASAPLNQYTDSTATNTGPYFYRIQVNP